jgi:hypothetical protein
VHVLARGCVYSPCLSFSLSCLRVCTSTARLSHAQPPREVFFLHVTGSVVPSAEALDCVGIIYADRPLLAKVPNVPGS